TTGEGITVAVIDGRINPDIPEFEGADLRVREDSFCTDVFDSSIVEPAVSKGSFADHGTNVTAMVVGGGRGINGEKGIRGVAPGATVLFYGASAEGDGTGLACVDVDGVDSVGSAISNAVDDGADIISLSLSTAYRPDIADAMLRAHRSGVIVLVASPQGNDLQSGFGPSMMVNTNGVVVVESGGPDGGLVEGLSLSDPLVTVVAPGAHMRTVNGHAGWGGYRLQHGSSFATPWVAGALA
ncbi:hypothetical protein N869_12340, partial [Cellulomonas bogoriensis 69B4 = DSM 16987]